MPENLENKEVKKNDENVNKKDEKGSTKKIKKMKRRTLFVLIFLCLFVFGTIIMYRAEYIETVEIGAEYAEVFNQNVKYKLYIGCLNFIVVFSIALITNKLIKKGLRQFFEEEKKEMPKLPNKSLALVLASVTSIIISNLFLQKVILFINTAQFGKTDPLFGMDIGFYMFRSPLIRTAFILWYSNINNFSNIHS